MSKYKFDLAPKVKGFVEWQLEHYHEDRQQLEQYKKDLIPSNTAGYSLSGGVSKGGTSKPTENVGIKMATSPYVMATERGLKAIDRVLDKLDGIDKQLIDLIYWKKSYTIIGAGVKVGLKEHATYTRINNILGLVALEMGLVNI